MYTQRTIYDIYYKASAANTFIQVFLSFLTVKMHDLHKIEAINSKVTSFSQSIKRRLHMSTIQSGPRSVKDLTLHSLTIEYLSLRK